MMELSLFGKLLAYLVLATSVTACADAPSQSASSETGPKAAIALTYDDALNSQLDHAAPALDSLGYKATFYVSLNFTSFEPRKAEWKKLAVTGHELGNHTINHPCRSGLPGRDWVSPERDLDTYSKEKLLSEIKAANEILAGIDGKTDRTFAYTCGDTTVGGESFIEDLRPIFTGARSVIDDSHFDPYFVASFAVNNTSASDMIAYVDRLIANDAIGSITFHGIGGDHLSISVSAHQELLDYLASKRSEIWVAPLRDILEREAQAIE